MTGKLQSHSIELLEQMRDQCAELGRRLAAKSGKKHAAVIQENTTEFNSLSAEINRRKNNGHAA